ncbi:MAG: hypothetical protein ACK5LT_06350 [Lachnospirales bacterium]
MTKRYMVFIFSIFVNAFGNALMLKGSVGSTPWAAAFDNMAQFTNLTPGACCIILSIIFYIVAKIVGKDFDMKETIICAISSASYGGITDLYLLVIGYEPSTSVVVNYILAIVGIVVVAYSVSIAIQANVGYLAIDNYARNLKVYVFKNNVIKAVLFTSATAIAIAVVTGFLSGRIKNITVLTLLVTLFLGNIIAVFDKLCVIKFPNVNRKIVQSS